VSKPKLETLHDADMEVRKMMAEPGATKQLDADLVKCRLFAADILTQARENDFDGGVVVGAACYFMAAALASTTTANHMSADVRQLIVDNAISMMKDAFNDMRKVAEERGL